MKRLMLFTAALAVTAYARTGITLNVSASQTVEPDTMRASLQYEMTEEREAPVAQAFNALVKSVKAQNRTEGLECRGGSYRISPRYTWEKGVQHFTGYQGSVSFDCEFLEVGAFNRLLEATEQAVRPWPKAKRHQGAVHWAVSETRSEELTRELETRVIRHAMAKAATLSEATGLECGVANIVFGNVPAVPVPMLRAAAAEASAVPVEVPIQGESERSIDVTVTYLCE